MLDIGWTELLVIAVILIVVVGPKDLPPMIRAFGKMTKRLRQTAGEFRAQFDEALREAELDDLKNSVNDLRSLNPANTIRETLNPLRQMGQEIKSDLERTTRPDSKPASTGDDFEQNSILPDLPFGLDEPPQELKPVAQAQAQAQAPASEQPAPAPQAVSAPGPAVAVPASAPAAMPEATTSAPATSAPAAPAPAKARKAATQKPSAKTEAPAKNPIKPAKAAPVAKTVAAPTKTAAAASKAKPSKSAATKAPSVQTPSTATKAPAKPRKTKSEDRA